MLIWTKATDEEMENCQMIPDSPGAARAVRCDRLELATDLQDRGSDTVDVAGCGELHDIACLKRCDHFGIDTASCIGLFGLGCNLGKERRNDPL